MVRFANENLGRASAVAVRPAGCEQQSFSTTSSKNSDLMFGLQPGLGPQPGVGPVTRSSQAPDKHAVAMPHC